MKKQFALAMLLALAPVAASADGLSYTYVEGGYAQLDQDLPSFHWSNLFRAEPDDVEAGGAYLDGSVAIGESFHLLGGYRKGEDEVEVTVIPLMGGDSFTDETDVDLSQFHLGLGYHRSVGERSDLVAELNSLHTKIESNDNRGDVSGNDVRVTVGVRHLLADAVEVWAKGNYTDGDFYDGTFSGTVGLQYRFNATWGMVGEVEAGSDFSQYTVGVRASF